MFINREQIRGNQRIIKKEWVMLTLNQVEKLEIVKGWLEEIRDSEELQELDYDPDITIGDAVQAVKEVLREYYPDGYEPPLPVKPVMHLRRVRTFAVGLLSEAAVTSLLISGFLGIGALFSWGMTEVNRTRVDVMGDVDWEMTTDACKGGAVSAFAVFLGCSLSAGCIEGSRTR